MACTAMAGIVAPREYETARVTYIYDGDTFKASGRKIRIIGINTPEVRDKDDKPEPFAKAAKRKLVALIYGKKVLLIKDQELQDKYGRDLRHVFLPDRSNVSEIILREGLAQFLAVPPNLKYARRYLQAQDYARKKSRRIWGTKFKGKYNLKRAKVNRIYHTKKSVWLEFSGKLKARISRADLRYFKNYCFKCLADKKVDIQGWWEKRRGFLQTRIYHPLAINLVK